MQAQSVGKTIYTYRRQKNLTQEQLAGQVGVSPGAVSKWENGASLPDIAMLKPLARALGISIDTLLGFEAALTDEEAARIRESLMDTFLQQGYEAGAAACKAALQEYPNSVALKLAAANLMQMYIGTADGVTEDLVRGMQRYVMGLYRQVQESGDPKYAPLALFAMAGLHMGAGNYAAAEQALGALPADLIDPNALWPMLLLRQEKWEEAEALSKRLLLSHLNACTNMLNTCAQAAMARQAYESARFYLRAMERLEEEFGIGLGAAHLMLARLQLETGEYAAAAQSYQTYIQALVHTPYAPYSGNPYFADIALSAKPDAQRAVRLAMYRALLDEEDAQWEAIKETEAYQSAMQLLRDALEAQ